jgi:hypothetical protein
MTNISKISTTVISGLLVFTGSALAAFPSFDDLPLASTYHTGDTMMSDGIAVKFEDFQYDDGSWTPTGEATVTNALWAHGSLNELNTNNINAHYDFAGSIGTQTQVELLFGEYGGNINIAVNGDFANVGNFMDVHGAVLGGCNITVVSGGFGGDHGELVILGAIQDLIIGGQELAVDVRPDDECEPAFEDLPLGSVYFNGDSFTTGGVPVDVGPFKFWDGTVYTAGHVLVEDWNQACGTGQELFTNNANVRFDFASVSPVNNLIFEFGEYGGNINVAINGDFRNVANYRNLDGAVIGGVTFSVTSGGWGNDCGRVECSGVVNKLVLGGQEHFIDCLEFDWMQLDDCEPSYEDLPLGTVYVNGDTFATDAYKYLVDRFTYSDGTSTTGGDVSVENGGNACSANNELHYNNATTLIQRMDGDWMTDVSFKFGEYGGNLNLEINGDFRNFNNMLDIDGAVIGGVTVTVDWGGGGGDCGQVSFAGDMQYLRMGGQEYWVDCFKADSTPAPIPGDIDGDGDVDLDDLLALIAAWGTADAAADLNGDGVVNLDDLLILLAHFGS